MQNRNLNRNADIVPLYQVSQQPTQPTVEALLLQVIQLLQIQQSSAAVPAPQPAPTQDPVKDTLTVKQALQEVFGGKFSEYKFRSMINRGEVPSIRIGSKILLRRSSLLAWIEEQESQGAHR
ncbi:helix-turn-helix domain-containing protein [Gorillibacterium timonense]|uniref:helix-turn-helix domain-containing protein n=1 Tax=Gorillibacterium timonense TaxID=1689269 RepID=UPI00071CF896|nr:helix-turn-helix domain-containing protein [Gorillibacterium timonense]